MKRGNFKLVHIANVVDLHFNEREVIFHQKLDHPLVIKFIEAFSDHYDYPYIVSELAE